MYSDSTKHKLVLIVVRARNTVQRAVRVSLTYTGDLRWGSTGKLVVG